MADASSLQVLVGMGEIETFRADTEISVLGIGSGVVVVAFEKTAGIGACAHFILPFAPCQGEVVRPGKYVEPGLKEMVRRMVEIGASESEIEFAMIGGAGMIGSAGAAPLANLGSRNVEAVREAIEGIGFRIMALDVGGQEGRTVSFCSRTATVRVRGFRQGERVLCHLRG